jgi:hypothetical protein
MTQGNFPPYPQRTRIRVGQPQREMNFLRLAKAARSGAPRIKVPTSGNTGQKWGTQIVKIYKSKIPTLAKGGLEWGTLRR